MILFLIFYMYPADHRIGPCFTRIEGNMCRGQLVGVKCSKSSCCSTVGAAWGIPCSKCSSKRECERGLIKDPRTGKCEDINECRGIPNICAMGTCINTIGSYRCECGPGRVYNTDKFECSGKIFWTAFHIFFANVVMSKKM